MGELSRSMLRSPRFAEGIVGLFACCHNGFFTGSGLGCGRTAQGSLTLCLPVLWVTEHISRCTGLVFLIQFVFLAKQTSSLGTVNLML